ncbi:MAG: OsmC family peroxiredoxin [Actinomycetia bacterium]|jgi:osmotically inducible protein OsmC|nr:OsmC family peroxiredoxin [Actinomycetes bacterium]
MSKHHAKAIWTGSVPAGTGTMQLGKEGPTILFNLKARVEEEMGTNPEQMIGAALAGCFSMSLANLVEESGHSLEGVEINTNAVVTLAQTPEGFRIPQINLNCVGTVPGMDAETFSTLAVTAKETCPVSLLYAAANITLESSVND